MNDLRVQPAVKYGELQSPFTGRILSDSEVSTYNRYTADFNRFTYTAEKEHMLDQRHRFILSCFYEGFE
jgi:hypothetical protein|tara:strand:+ start:552 stop:758 length:207 start_codon:yes stop_codon:yes gene_type:complete